MSYVTDIWYHCFDVSCYLLVRTDNCTTMALSKGRHILLFHSKEWRLEEENKITNFWNSNVFFYFLVHLVDHCKPLRFLHHPALSLEKFDSWMLPINPSLLRENRDLSMEFWLRVKQANEAEGFSFYLNFILNYTKAEVSDNGQLRHKLDVLAF